MAQSKGFTLIEVLIAAVIISVVSLAGSMAASVLFRSHEMSLNRSTAVNLLQRSQEQFQRASRTFFDTLENCQFPDEVKDPDPCGFNMLENAGTFTRFAQVNLVDNSTELKRVTITVGWNELGQAKQLQSTVLIARPPDTLPGNIIGSARSTETGNPLIPVNITARLQNGSFERVTQSNTLQDINFDFSDHGFILPPGNYTLTAQDPSGKYFPYTYSMAVLVELAKQTRVDIFLKPRPANATINVRAVHQEAVGQILSRFDDSGFHLAESGMYRGQLDGQPSRAFTIGFEEDQEQRCFTIKTENAFLTGYAAHPSCSFLYNRRGWSSAQYTDSGALSCGNSYDGSQASDRICVAPGETVEVIAPLVRVPEVTITGRVVDNNGVPLAGATVIAWWPQWQEWKKDGNRQASLQTSVDGRFEYSVPAVQDLFPNNSDEDHLIYHAYAQVQITDCCNEVKTVHRGSGYFRAKALTTQGGGYDVGDIVINAVTTDCGNAQGTIKNDQSGSGISGATVTVMGTGAGTDVIGKYLYNCPAEGFRLPVGDSDFRISKPGFYDYWSGGTVQYAPAAPITIKKNDMVSYDAKMWPQGFGNIHVTVTDKGTHKPIAGATIAVQLYNGAWPTLTSNNTGQANFDTIVETWPPPPEVLAPGNSYYNYTPRGHILHVSHPSGIYRDSPPVIIPTLRDGETLDIPVELETQGQL